MFLVSWSFFLVGSTTTARRRAEGELYYFPILVVDSRWEQVWRHSRCQRVDDISNQFFTSFSERYNKSIKSWPIYRFFNSCLWKEDKENGNCLYLYRWMDILDTILAFAFLGGRRILSFVLSQLASYHAVTSTIFEVSSLLYSTS